MNKKQNFVSPDETQMRGSVMLGDYPDSSEFENDYDDSEIGDYDNDDDEISGDYDESDFSGDTFEIIGDRVSKRAARKTARKAAKAARKGRIRSSRPQNPAVKAANQSAATTKAIPGATLAAGKLSPMMVTNGTIITKGTNLILQGYSVKSQLDRFVQLCANLTRQVSAACASGSTSVTIPIVTAANFASAFGTATTAGIDLITPVIFLLISGNALNSAPGMHLTVSMTSVDELGRSNTVQTWTFERDSVTTPTKIALWPVKDVSTRLISGLVRISATCTTPGTWVPVNTFSLTVSGLTEGQTVIMKVPGLDSEELRDFLKPFSIKLT